LVDARKFHSGGVTPKRTSEGTAVNSFCCEVFVLAAIFRFSSATRDEFPVMANLFPVGPEFIP
jgi:hypothetical protein